MCTQRSQTTAACRLSLVAVLPLSLSLAHTPCCSNPVSVAIPSRCCRCLCAALPLQALKMTGSCLGKSQLRVLPSKTAIVPVNKELMPRSEEELERCSRTVYVANIDKKVDREDVRLFFEKLCGECGEVVRWWVLLPALPCVHVVCASAI